MPPERRPSRRCRPAMVRCFGERLARQSAPRCQDGRIVVVTRVVHVPYVVEQDEDGVWCASAQLRPGVGAVGDGPTAEAAVADLRDALEALLAEVGPPDELTLTLDVA
jgi:predicted RNase H-like HicB family nuclease